MAHSSNCDAPRKGIRAGLAILTAGPRYLLQPQFRYKKGEMLLTTSAGVDFLSLARSLTWLPFRRP